MSEPQSEPQSKNGLSSFLANTKVQPKKEYVDPKFTAREAYRSKPKPHNILYFSIDLTRLTLLKSILKDFAELLEVVTLVFNENGLYLRGMEETIQGAFYVLNIPYQFFNNWAILTNHVIVLKLSELNRTLSYVNNKTKGLIEFTYDLNIYQLEVTYKSRKNDIHRQIEITPTGFDFAKVIEKMADIDLQCNLVFKGKESILDFENAIKQSANFPDTNRHLTLTFSPQQTLELISKRSDSENSSISLNLKDYQFTSDSLRHSNTIDYDYLENFIKLLSNDKKVSFVDSVILESQNEAPLRIFINYKYGLKAGFMVAPIEKDDPKCQECNEIKQNCDCEEFSPPIQQDEFVIPEDIPKVSQDMALEFIDIEKNNVDMEDFEAVKTKAIANRSRDLVVFMNKFGIETYLIHCIEKYKENINTHYNGFNINSRYLKTEEN